MAAAAARGGANFVKFYFYAGNTISVVRKEKLVALAYSTARDQKLAPKEILIRLVFLIHGFDLTVLCSLYCVVPHFRRRTML